MKTIPLSEALRQAAPLPLTVTCGTVIEAKTGWTPEHAWFLGASERFHVASTNENRRRHSEQLATAALLAHCFNNFAEAVALLKLASRSMGCRCSHASDCGHEPGCAAGKIIEACKRFETVEVP